MCCKLKMAGVGDPYHSDSSVSDGDLVHSSGDEEFFHGHSVGGYMFEPDYNEAEYAPVSYTHLTLPTITEV